MVTDGCGFTLCIYQPDRQGRRCAPECERCSGPPLVPPRGVRRPVAGPGVNPARLATAPRVGCVLQVTRNRWPLYLWQGDLAPGQATGQEEGMGAWYVLLVSGSVGRLPPP